MMTRRLLLAALLAIVASGLGLALQARQDPKPPEGAVVPFEMLPSNHMVVKAKINGKGPFRLVFDLGAPITLLGSKAAESSGVIKPDAPKAFLFGMRGEGKAEVLEVGDLKAKDLPVIVMDHPL